MKHSCINRLQCFLGAMGEGVRRGHVASKTHQLKEEVWRLPLLLLHNIGGQFGHKTTRKEQGLELLGSIAVETTHEHTADTIIVDRRMDIVLYIIISNVLIVSFRCAIRTPHIFAATTAKTKIYYLKTSLGFINGIINVCIHPIYSGHQSVYSFGSSEGGCTSRGHAHFVL